MTIAEFASILEEFISEYDSVVVPGLGVFRAKLEAAEISDRGFTINPPYRSISFEGGMEKGSSANDLVFLYSSKYRKEQDAVDAEMGDMVREIHNSLASESECELHGIGTLRLVGGEWPVLIPDMALDIYPEGFGLESVSLKNRQVLGQPAENLSRAYIAKTESPVEKEEVKEESKHKSHPWRWVWVTLLVLCVLAVAAFFLLAQFAPDVLDTLLYSPEELEIIQSTKQ